MISFEDVCFAAAQFDDWQVRPTGAIRRFGEGWQLQCPVSALEGRPSAEYGFVACRLGIPAGVAERFVYAAETSAAATEDGQMLMAYLNPWRPVVRR